MWRYDETGSALGAIPGKLYPYETGSCVVSGHRALGGPGQPPMPSLSPGCVAEPSCPQAPGIGQQ